MSDLHEGLGAEAHRIEEDCLHSARSHFEVAAVWRRRHYQIGIPTTVLAAMTGGSALTGHPTLAAVLGMLVTALSALSVFLNPSERAHEHHAAGTRFNEIRNQARIFREIDLRSGSEVGPLIGRLKQLATARDSTNKSTPQIPRWAFERGKSSIAAGEARYDVDARE